MYLKKDALGFFFLLKIPVCKIEVIELKIVPKDWNRIIEELAKLFCPPSFQCFKGADSSQVVESDYKWLSCTVRTGTSAKDGSSKKRVTPQRTVLNI